MRTTQSPDDLLRLRVLLIFVTGCVICIRLTYEVTQSATVTRIVGTSLLLVSAMIQHRYGQTDLDELLVNREEISLANWLAILLIVLMTAIAALVVRSVADSGWVSVIFFVGVFSSLAYIVRLNTKT